MNTDAKQLSLALTAPFPADAVHWKPLSVKDNRALAAAYLDARAIMQRLDTVFGVGGWQDAYQLVAGGSVACTLSIRVDGEWVVKTDVGSPSEQPDDGDKLKAAFSDALKRAVVIVGYQQKRIIGAVLQLRRFPVGSEVLPLAGVGRTALAVLRPPDSGQDDNGGPVVGELADVIHRHVDRSALVAMLAGRRYALDVVQHQQAGVEGIGRRRHVR